jgi:hypothetical protein
VTRAAIEKRVSSQACMRLSSTQTGRMLSISARAGRTFRPEWHRYGRGGPARRPGRASAPCGALCTAFVSRMAMLRQDGRETIWKRERAELCAGSKLLRWRLAPAAVAVAQGILRPTQ